MTRDFGELLQSAVSGRYRIEEEIGRGGAARVFKARDLRHARDVALKVMRPEMAISPDRFLREILIVAGLQHPHIVPLFDSGQAEGLPFYVMPLIHGQTLRTRLESVGRLPLPEVLSVALEAAEALAYAHSRGLIHRDVKPENILLSEGHVMLSDFGIARAIERSVETGTTGSGVAIGTPAYMSPEQASADPRVDARSDQYSLACVVYEMLCGGAPYGSITSTPQTILRESLRAALPDLRTQRPEAPPSVAAAVKRALLPDPAQRFESVDAFADALVDHKALVHRSGPRARLVSLASMAPTRLSRVLAITGIALAFAATAFAIVRFRAEGTVADELFGTLDPRRIAVLYFDDHSPDKSLGYLANGLTESLIHELSSVNAIQVMSRNGVKPFRNSATPIDSIVKALRVGSLVEGSVQRSQNRVRLTVQLIDARTNTHLESSTLERDMGELFLLQDDLARHVSDLLRRKIGAEVRIRTAQVATRSVRARELLFRADRARYEADVLGASDDTVNLRRSVAKGEVADSLLAEAEKADPRWHALTIERGWVAMQMASRQSGAQRLKSFDRAVSQANRGLTRDSVKNSAAFELRGTAYFFRGERAATNHAEWQRYLALAQEDLERSVGIDSSVPRGWGTLSRVLIARGDVAAAERAGRIALAMDTYLDDAPSILQALYAATLMQDSLASSWNWCSRGADAYPQNPAFITCRLTLMAEDRAHRPQPRLAAELVAAANRLEPPARARAAGLAWLPIYREMLRAVILARAGERDSARAIAARAQVSVGSDAELAIDLKYEQAFLHLALNEPSAAIEYLSEYLAARPSLRRLVAKHPRWRPLWNDPRFVALVR